MSDKKILVGDMSRETAIGILKLMLEAMEVYDSIAPTPQRRNAVQMAIASLETDEAYQLEYERTTKNCESCRYYGLHHEVCNYCYKCSLWTEQEPTTKNDLGVDCISREATVKRLCNLAEFMNKHKENSGDPYIMAALFIQDNKTEFPSVTPQEPRKGMRWIGRFETYEWGEKEEWCECPWCHMDSAEAYNFCPNCGADFREVKKSEDKE